MKALMSYTSSVLEWLGRYVGLLVFGLLFVTALFIRTTMMTGYFEWAEISSVPWYVYVSGGVILLLMQVLSLKEQSSSMLVTSP